MGRRQCHCSLSGHITLVVIHFIRRENENEITISFILVEMRKSKSKSRGRLRKKNGQTKYDWTFIRGNARHIYKNSSGSRLEVVNIFFMISGLIIAPSKSIDGHRLLGLRALKKSNFIVQHNERMEFGNKGNLDSPTVCTAWYFIAPRALTHCVWVLLINENECWLLISLRKSQFNSIEGVMFQKSAHKISKERTCFSRRWCRGGCLIIYVQIRLPATCKKMD